MSEPHLHASHTDIAKRLKRAEGHLRKVIAANDLPEYALQEVAGKGGPMLIMTLRAALPTPASGEGG